MVNNNETSIKHN